MARVIVFGSLNQDLQLRVPRQPRPGETLMSGDIVQAFGGKGANQAVAAALAGADTVFVGAVGDDPQGRAYATRLQSFGIDTSRLRTVADRPTGTAVISLDDGGENMIIVAPGANFALGRDDLAALDDLGPGDVLLMQLELPIDLVVRAARAAHGAGARVIINAAPYAALPGDVLAFCDPLVVNEHEAALLEADGGAPASLLVTRGTAGSDWGDDHAEAVAVTAVDTTGAGDAYCGTLAAELARGADRAAAMAAASAASSRNVQHAGAQPPAPR